MFSLSERFRYRFDNLLAKGTLALIGALALFSVITIVVSGFVVTLVDARPDDAKEGYSFFEATWLALTREMDAGNVAGDSGVALRVIMFGATVAGIFIFSTF